MESGPVRSQALHNFALPFWGKNNKLHRKFIDSSEQQQQQSSSPLHHNSSSSCSETQFQPNIHGNHKQQPEFQNPKNLIVSKSVNKNRSSHSPVQHKKNQTNFSESVDIVVDELKLNSVNRHHRSTAVEKVNKSEGVVVEGEESTPKPWNLRPRRVFKTPTTEINVVGGGGANKNGEFREKTENLPKSLRLRGFIEGGQTVENKEKKKFWISLSREEIELDFFVLTGSKPPRKPKKRSKIVQNQLDNVFPGLWMVGASVDSYTVPNGSAKR